MVVFKKWLLQEACKDALPKFSSHAVVKDYGPPLIYHPGLSRTQHGALLKALMNSLIRLPAARKTTSNWSVAVQYCVTVYLMSLQTFPEIMPHIVEDIKMLERALKTLPLKMR